MDMSLYTQQLWEKMEVKAQDAEVTRTETEGSVSRFQFGGTMVPDATTSLNRVLTLTEIPQSAPQAR